MPLTRRDLIRGSLAGGQTGGGRNDRLVTGVESGAEQQDGRDATDDIREVRSLIGMKGAAKQREFPVAEPLLENLIAAKRVIPDIDRNRSPERVAIQVDVDAGIAQQRESFGERQRLRGRQGFEPGQFGLGSGARGRSAASGHDRVSLAAASPARCHLERLSEVW